MVQTEFEDSRSGGIVFLGVGDLFLGSGQKSDFLFLLGFRGVFLQQFEKAFSLVLVDGLGELIQSWWDFESIQDDSLLSLVEDVFGPSDETGHVSLVLDITTDSEVLGSSFEQWVLNFLDNFFFSNLVRFLDLNKLIKF